MWKLSYKEVEYLTSKLVECLRSHNNFTNMNINDMNAYSPSFTVYSYSWSLGKIFANSGMKWSEFEAIVTVAFRKAVNE